MKGSFFQQPNSKQLQAHSKHPLNFTEVGARDSKDFPHEIETNDLLTLCQAFLGQLGMVEKSALGGLTGGGKGVTDNSPLTTHISVKAKSRARPTTSQTGKPTST